MQQHTHCLLVFRVVVFSQASEADITEGLNKEFLFQFSSKVRYPYEEKKSRVESVGATNEKKISIKDFF